MNNKWRKNEQITLTKLKQLIIENCKKTIVSNSNNKLIDVNFLLRFRMLNR